MSVFNYEDFRRFLPDKAVRLVFYSNETCEPHINCLSPGTKVPLHYHPVSDEVHYYVEGEGEATLGDTKCKVTPGTVIHIPKGTVHGVYNNGSKPLSFFTVITPRPKEGGIVFVEPKEGYVTQER
jgi:quercetin dioxygenase-like cupin family protein